MSIYFSETANSLVSFDWTCTCSELSDWFRKFYAWEPLEWYLNTLRKIGTDCGNEECCDVYKNECENRMYNMAGLFDNIYDRSCKSQCQPASRGINDEHSVTRSRMCYDSMIEIEKEARNSSIWFDDQVPFAGLQFCQINGESSYSPWTCLDSSAKASLIVCCIIISLMALASVVSNILVLKIYCSRKRLRSAIGYRWRISFAISDLLVGLVVLPSAVYNIYLRYMKERDPYPAGPGGFDDTGETHSFIGIYLEVVGALQVIAVASEIYGLMFHSIERCVNIRYPLLDRKMCITMDRAVIATILFTWLFSIIMAVVLYFFPMELSEAKTKLELISYSCNYFNLFGCNLYSIQDESLIIFIVIYSLPLLIVWFVNILLYRSIRVSSSHPLAQAAKDDQTKVARTLIVLTLTFSLFILPLIICAITGILLDTVYINIPEHYDPNAANLFNSFVFLAVLVSKMNGFANIGVYYYRNEEFCRELKSLFAPFRACKMPKIVEGRCTGTGSRQNRAKLKSKISDPDFTTTKKT